MAVNLINSNDIEVEQTGQDIQLKTSTPISIIEGNIGDLTLLNTTDKSSVVNAINEVNSKNIISVYLSANTDVNNGSIIPFTTSNSIGSKLTFENNGIKIGVGVSKVMVNFNLSVRYTATTGKVYGADMLINGTAPGDASGKQLAVRAHKSIGEPINSSSGVRIIDVNENDVLTLKVNSGATCPCTPTTFLTVEVVE